MLSHLKEGSEVLVKLGVPGAVVEARRLAAPVIPVDDDDREAVIRPWSAALRCCTAFTFGT